MGNDIELSGELKKLNVVLTKMYKTQTLGQTFLRGVLSGLGSVVGATLVVALIVYLLRQIDVVPIIGNWLSGIFSQVIENLSTK